jgi:hypothetical protein
VANRFDLPANRGNMAGTRRNAFLLSAMYDVPVGQNRKFLSHMNRISDLALGGWSVSAQSLGDRTISDADHKFELRSRQSQPFLSRQLTAPGLHRQRQRRECRNRKHVQHRCVQSDS